MAIRPAGFAVEVNDFDRTTSPLGIRFVNCTALDRQPAPTMKYGFVNEVLAPSDGRYNECINCVSIGHTASPTTRNASGLLSGKAHRSPVDHD